MYRSALPGQRFERLVVTEIIDGRRRRCRCDCGATLTVERCNLTSGNSKSCGCLRSEHVAEYPATHGATRGGKRSRAHSSWHNMLQRCANPNNPKWADYGGRGITVCERWLNSFTNFLADMGEPPEGRTLDRIDNEGDYEPGNCRWATQRDQVRNRRTTRNLTFDGRTQSIAAWATELDLTYGTIRDRLRRGWSVDRALTQGVRHVVR